ncbi:MAG: hypothetical protein ACN6PJ_04615 [Achromobacter sp.]|uniref:hypothetical protein n=1 Tax=Achromobacter sp. TaxID=134375 RepID=UPI003CFC1E50
MLTTELRHARPARRHRCGAEPAPDLTQYDVTRTARPLQIADMPAQCLEGSFHHQNLK